MYIVLRKKYVGKVALNFMTLKFISGLKNLKENTVNIFLLNI